MKPFQNEDRRDSQRDVREHSLLQRAVGYSLDRHVNMHSVAAEVGTQIKSQLVERIERAEECSAAYSRHTAERVGQRLNHLSGAVSDATLQMDRRQRALKAEVVAGTHLVDALIERLDALESKMAQLSGPAQPSQSPTADTGKFFAHALAHASVEAALTAFGPIFVIKGDLVGDSVIATGVWDEHIYPIIESAAQRGGACVDVGAQFGIHSSVLSTFFPEVYAFEPNIISFRILALNSFFRPRIRPFNFALYDSEGVQSLSDMSEQDAPFTVDPQLLQIERSDNVGSVSFSPKGTAFNSVRSITLDSLRLNNVCFIKVDAQGADGRVLRGARSTIARCRPLIVFEWEDRLAVHHQVELEEIFTMLRSLGYDVRKLKEHNAKQTDYLATPT